MLIVTLRSNIRFKVDGYETPVTLGQKIDLEIKVRFSFIFKNAFITFAFKGSNPLSFFRENETESRLPFSESLKLKVGRFRKIVMDMYIMY